MIKKGLIAAVAVVFAMSALVWAAVENSKKKVMTVTALLRGGPQQSVRVGARVAEREIDYQTSPSFLLRFSVQDPAAPGPLMPVSYPGIMPDTLKIGRDVVLEGGFDGRSFAATSLLTQCPSKYEPPVPK